MMDLPDEAMFKTLIKNFIHKELPKALSEVEGLLNRNRIFGIAPRASA